MLEVPTSAELRPEQLATVRSHLQEVLSSVAFLGSHRAQTFLQVVVEHKLAGRSVCLRERLLGAELFGRPIDYDTGNDSVVRVKASDVRRRLSEYYQSRATPPTVQIELPSGTYTPHFHWAPEEASRTTTEPVIANSVEIATQPEDGHTADAALLPRWKPWVFRAVLVAAYSAVLVSLTWFAAVRFNSPPRTPTATDPIWAALFDGKRSTYIVPADIGFDLLEDSSHRPMTLADYLKGGYLDLALPGVNPNVAEGLRSQRLTSFVDAQIIASLARLPDYNPQRTFLRFPRDLRLDDLKGRQCCFHRLGGKQPLGSHCGQ